MVYLRNVQQVSDFCIEHKIELDPKLENISTYIEQTLNLFFIGYFHSMLDGSFWTYSGECMGRPNPVNKFAVTTDGLDFLLNSGIFSDSSTEADGYYTVKPVKIFGRMEKGKITEMMGLKKDLGLQRVQPF
jgi:hypothetical protein